MQFCAGAAIFAHDPPAARAPCEAGACPRTCDAPSLSPRAVWQTMQAMTEPAAGPSSAESGVLTVSVSDPVTQGEGPRSFVSFRVATSTDLPAFKWKSFSVIRRYRDFAWLHDRLSDLYPGARRVALATSSGGHTRARLTQPLLTAWC